MHAENVFSSCRMHDYGCDGRICMVPLHSKEPIHCIHSIGVAAPARLNIYKVPLAILQVWRILLLVSRLYRH